MVLVSSLSYFGVLVISECKTAAFDRYKVLTKAITSNTFEIANFPSDQIRIIVSDMSFVCSSRLLYRLSVAP